MKFTVYGDIYMNTEATRRYRAMKMPDNVHIDFNTHDDFDRKLVRFYPIVMTVSASNISRDAFSALVDDLRLYASETPTMGLLDANGLNEAICFEHECGAIEESFGSVYVVPEPQFIRNADHPRSHSWERVAKAVTAAFPA